MTNAKTEEKKQTAASTTTKPAAKKPTEKPAEATTASSQQNDVQAEGVEQSGDKPLEQHPEGEVALVPFAIATVQAKNKNGFYRVGRRWKAEPKDVLVLSKADDLDAVKQQLSDTAEFDIYITMDEYKRLEAEPMLAVSLRDEV